MTRATANTCDGVDDFPKNAACMHALFSARRFPNIGATLLVCLMLMTPSASANPVFGREMPLVQPNGDGFMARGFGDERSMMVETIDGYTIQVSPVDGAWVYSVPDGMGGLMPSPYRVGEIDPAVIPLPKHLRPDRARLDEVRGSRLVFETPTGGPRMADSPRESFHGDGLGGKATEPLTGTAKVPVILVDFDDVAGAPQGSRLYTREDFDQHYFSVGELSRGSAADYFKEVSYDLYTVSGDVVDWTRAPNEYAYYVNGERGVGYDYPRNSQGLVTHIVQLVDPQVDFSKYDNDGDGSVDGVVVVVEGKATYDPDTFWPHMWALQHFFIELDGVRVDDYILVNEQDPWGNIEPVGTFCHEWGHVLGAPDMYDYDGGSPLALDNNNLPVHNWCIMASGNYNTSADGIESAGPSHYSGFIKYYWMGWVTPTDIVADGTYTVDAVNTSRENSLYRIFVPGSTTEYFLVENRRPGENQLFSRYDQNGNALDEGLLIMHIDETMIDEPADAFFNDGTPRRSHYGAQVLDPGEPARLTDYPHLYKYDAAFSAEDGQTEVSDSTTPAAMTGWYGPSGISISNISASGTSMTFDVAFGDSSVSAPELSVTTGQTTYSAGDRFSTSVSLQASSAAVYDLYLVVSLPDGSLYSYSGVSGFTAGLSTPWMSNWRGETISQTEVIAFTIAEGGLPAGTYRWYLAAVDAGADPLSSGTSIRAVAVSEWSVDE